MKRVAISLAACSLIFLSACTVGPKYVKPAVPTAPSFGEQPPAAFENTPGWTAATPADSQIRGDWWQLFNDAQLSQLEAQVAPANQTLKEAEANFRRARAAIQYNRSFRYPTVGTQPTYSNNRISGVVSYGVQGAQYDQFTLPISVSYDLDLWGRIRRAVNAAKEQYQASAADVENVKLELETDLAVDYFELRSLDLQKQILDNTVNAYTRALQLTQNRYQGGVASKVEVAQAQTQLEQAQAQDMDLESARAGYEHAIAVLTGQVPEGFHIAVDPLHATPPAVPVGVPSLLLERRPDIAIAERNMAAANEQIGIARAAYYPDLQISATGGLQAGSIVNWFTWPARFWAVGPALTQTLYDAGRRHAQVEDAEAAYDVNVADYRQTALTAFQEVEDNLATLRVLEGEQAKQHEATLAAENSLQLSLNRYKGGLVTYLEVITAQSIALVNERTEADILRRRMDATVLLIRAVGGGWDTSKLPKTT